MRASSSSHIQWFLVCALLSGVVACKSSASPTVESKEVVEQPVVAVEEAPVEEEPPSFCEEGAEEYSRRAYHWCVKDGALQGSFIATADNGKMILDGTFEKGVMTGKWTAYNPDNGRVIWRAAIENGLENGDVEGFDPSTGNLLYKLGFKAGLKDGESVYYDASGNKVAQIHFTAGKPSGTWTYWHVNGQKYHEYTYKTDGSGKTSIHKHWKSNGAKGSSPVGQLGRGDLVPVLRPLEENVVECYRHSRLIDDANGKVVAQLHIGYVGEVSHVDIFADNFDHPFMAICTRRQVEALRFPDNPYGPQQLLRTWELSVQ